jgi:hypothetical protein
VGLELYILIGSVGVVISLVLSEVYVSKRNKIYFGLYLLVSTLFNAQHYNVAFNNKFLNLWLFLLNGELSTPSEIIRNIGFVFFVLTLMTFPPSKLRLLYYVLFKRRKSKH